MSRTENIQIECELFHVYMYVGRPSLERYIQCTIRNELCKLRNQFLRDRAIKETLTAIRGKKNNNEKDEFFKYNFACKSFAREYNNTHFAISL